jgi:small subunit ribosomal protein S5
MQPRNDNRRDNRRGGRDQEPQEKLFDERVIVGDKKGKIGIGIAKGADVTTAVTKSVDIAKKHMFTVNLYKGTLPHESQAKVGGANILIKPAAAGTGLIAGGVVRTILEVAGVKNALSKSLGSSNKVNTAYATLDALQKLVPASQWVSAKAEAAPKKASAAKAVKAEAK